MPLFKSYHLKEKSKTMLTINIANATTPTILKVIPTDKPTVVYGKTSGPVQYRTTKHEFPIFIDGKMFTKYVPKFEGMYATNINGDLATLERTIVIDDSKYGSISRSKKTKICKTKREEYQLSNEGVALQVTRKGLIFYSGFKKPTFDENTVFPVDYRGKTWICWLPGNLHLKAALATDGSVLTMECMSVMEGELRKDFYAYFDERLSDSQLTNTYRNKEKTLPLSRHELVSYAKLKCKALGIQP